VTGLAQSVLLLGYAFIFAPALLAQPRIDLSPAQAQLGAAVDNLHARQFGRAPIRTTVTVLAATVFSERSDLTREGFLSRFHFLD
jgi:hypothetical protein